MDRAIRREKRLQQLDEQVARIKAEKRRLKALASQDERKRDTRRLILMGSLLRARIKNGAWSEERLKEAMDEFLERDRDRELFALPPRQGSEKGATQP